MIDKAEVRENDQEKIDYYYIRIHLKEKYHSEFERLTGNNVGNFFAVVYEDKMIHSSLPVIQTKIEEGKISIGQYAKEEKAKEILRQILNEHE